MGTKGESGFTVVELVVVGAIILILAGVAIPSVMTSYQTYRLGSVTTQVANLIELNRFTAIKRNMAITLRQTSQGNTTALYIDLDGDGAYDAVEPMVLLPADITFVNGQQGVPGPSSTGFPNASAWTTPASTITFDSRGTVAGAPAVYFIALGFQGGQTQYGLRAITVTPMGQTKTWTAAAGTSWATW